MVTKDNIIEGLRQNIKYLEQELCNQKEYNNNANKKIQQLIDNLSVMEANKNAYKGELQQKDKEINVLKQLKRGFSA